MYYGREFIKCINEVGPEKVKVVVTDNAPVMRAAWRIVEEEFPHITCIGCAAHSLDLIEDIMKMSSLVKILKMGRVVINTVKNTARILVHFKRYQKEQQERSGIHVTALKLYPRTRFAYCVIMLQSLVRNKEPLQQTVLLRDLDIDRRVKTIALDEDYFWVRVEAWIAVLSPISKAINLIEADDALLSDVPEAFYCISVDSLTEARNSPLQKVERKLKRLIDDRKTFVIKNIHLAANALDPPYGGQHLTSEEKKLELWTILPS